MIFSLVALFVVIVAFIIVSEIFTILFRLTGLPEKRARFQAVSLLTTSGFTTSESELITKTTIRRKIASAAMILGYTFSAAFISIFVSLIINLGTDGNKETIGDVWIIVLTLTSILVLFIILTKIKSVKNLFDKVVIKISYRILKTKNDNILTIIDKYSTDIIAEIHLAFIPELFVDKNLEKSRIKQDHGIIILAVARKNKIINNIQKDFVFEQGDVVTLYGDEKFIKEIFWAKPQMSEDHTETKHIEEKKSEGK